MALQHDLTHRYCNIRLYAALIRRRLLYLLTHDPCGDYSIEGGYHSKSNVYLSKYGLFSSQL